MDLSNENDIILIQAAMSKEFIRRDQAQVTFNESTANINAMLARVAELEAKANEDIAPNKK